MSPTIPCKTVSLHCLSVCKHHYTTSFSPCKCSPSLSAQIPFCSQFLSLIGNAGLCLWSMLLSLPPCLHIGSCSTLFSSTYYAKSFCTPCELVVFFKVPLYWNFCDRLYSKQNNRPKEGHVPTSVRVPPHMTRGPEEVVIKLGSQGMGTQVYV